MVLKYGWDLLDMLQDHDPAKVFKALGSDKAEDFKGMSSTDPKVRDETYRLIKDYGRDNGYFEFNSVTTQFDDWFEKTEGRLNLEDDAVLELDNRLNGMLGIDSPDDAGALRSEVNQLFVDKKIDAPMRKTLNDKIAKKSADALAVTSAKHEKNISWLADYLNTGKFVSSKLNFHLGTDTAGLDPAERQQAAPYIVTVVNGVATQLYYAAKKGDKFTPHEGLNPLASLDPEDKEDKLLICLLP